jgi:glucuronate isomerase
MQMGKRFIGEDFLLNNPTAVRLYHDYARDMPIFDYHNHLSPERLASNAPFENLTALWLQGDHYKWRAMRAHGVSEYFITGDASDEEKFRKWAETVPYTFRNPLFHWTHLELQRYFGIDELLTADNAMDVYQKANAQLATSAFTPRELLLRMRVRFVGTTDDPIDDLKWHQQLRNTDFSVQVCPTFRPDKSIAVENTSVFQAYLRSLESASNVSIIDFESYLDALRQRHDHFQSLGCRASDHGLDRLYVEPFSEAELRSIFQKVLTSQDLSLKEVACFKSGMLYLFAQWGHEKGWVQQYHIGPIRNGNTRMFRQLGPDTGWDSIGNPVDVREVNSFLDRVDQSGQLAKTILYSIHPGDLDPLATMIGNFNDGTYPGKIQLGAAWWFNDQKQGILQHLQSVSQMGLLSHFVGMLTDSRSFLSFPRHEYFRRILCNLLGEEIENGELPSDEKWIGEQIRNICYNNAVNYFNAS